MELSAKNKALIAVDLGAQSCRVSLLRWKDGTPTIRLIHRFGNAPLVVNETLRWDIDRIFEGVKEGLRQCAAAAPEGISSIGIDGWGVDYARLAEDGKPGWAAILPSRRAHASSDG